MVTLRWEKYTAKHTKSLGICIDADWADIDGVFHTIDDAKIAAQESVNSIVLSSIEDLEDIELAEKRLAENNPRTSLDDVKKQCDIQDGWISVVDDPPAIGEAVLIYDKHEGQNVAWLYRVNYREDKNPRSIFMSGLGCVAEPYDEYTHVAWFCEVTHWMPLSADPVDKV